MNPGRFALAVLLLASTLARAQDEHAHHHEEGADEGSAMAGAPNLATAWNNE